MLCVVEKYFENGATSSFGDFIYPNSIISFAFNVLL